MQYALPGKPVIQYSGSNSAEIIAAFEEDSSMSSPVPTITILSEANGVLEFHSDFDGGDFVTTLNIGDWIEISGGMGFGQAIEDFDTKWILF